ncbi:MAG: tRNA 2-selenouridine(34) synthase MnmH [Phenylobacterium sp.]|uniref:tRNA 2-selenouridine(34) synthase MnmH n=1 Tax=Phenylobacterium sp. TaxID=1871053 RepID=UPI001A343686|nr:tRNA 2-selenouridine(34) synthase MnmH [Phenylobacterium sp.]MBJ7413070.1 tRNA 2-selenouridine(34) synthase MnmH [Phenylobacterium sp.]
MSLEVTQDVSPAALARFDMVIDVRSPGEFAEDHVPGAVNLPVLSDAERAQVGTVYVQQSRFTARRLGAAHVARNVAHHLETALADRPGGFRPLVYCWRGGMRSNAMATILSQVGWRTTVLAGGYRTYRREVVARLYDGALSLNFVLLDGQTGSGKTEMLGRLAARGVQTLDLEGLAAHRGSLFGAIAGRAQPSQKLFESRLLGALDALDPARPVVAEAESSKIGERMIPPALWTRLAAAPRIELSAARADRARYLVSAYGDLIADRAAMEAAFARLPIRPSAERLAAWRGMIASSAFADLAEAIMGLHYDPAYDRARRKHDRPLLATLDVVPTDPTSQDAAADAIARLAGA